MAPLSVVGPLQTHTMAPTPSPSHNSRPFAFFNSEVLIVNTYLPLAKTLGFVVVEDRECTTVHGYWNAKTGQMQLINSNFPLTRKRSLIITQSSMTHQYLVRKLIMEIGKAVWLAKLSCDPNDIEGVFMPKSFLVRLFPITSNVSRRDPRSRVLDEYDAIWRGRKELSKSNSNWRSYVFKYGGERLRLAMLPHFPPANSTVREREDLWATVFDISHVTQLLSLIGTAVDLERIMSDDEHVNTRECIFHLYCIYMRGQWRYHHVLKSEQDWSGSGRRISTREVWTRRRHTMPSSGSTTSITEKMPISGEESSRTGLLSGSSSGILPTTETPEVRLRKYSCVATIRRGVQNDLQTEVEGELTAH